MRPFRLIKSILTDTAHAVMVGEANRKQRSKTMSAVLIAPPGLSGVVVADTEIGDVRGRRLLSLPAVSRDRAGPAQQLRAGVAPVRPRASARRSRVGRVYPHGRAVAPDPAEIGGIVASAALLGVPRTELSALRTALSAVGAATGARPPGDATDEEGLADALRAAAMTPTLLAAMHRFAQRRRPGAPARGPSGRGPTGCTCSPATNPHRSTHGPSNSI